MQPDVSEWLIAIFGSGQHVLISFGGDRQLRAFGHKARQRPSGLRQLRPFGDAVATSPSGINALIRATLRGGFVQ